MFALRTCLLLPLFGLALVSAWPASAQAQKKHLAEEKGLKSTSATVESSIKFVNKSEQTIKVYWLDYEGERKVFATVKPGDFYKQDKTFLTHPWLITDEKDNAWHVYFPDSQPRTVEVFAPEKK